MSLNSNLLKPWIEKIAQSMNSPENKEIIQMFLIDPILSYIMDRCFSYFIIGAIIFGCMLILIISIFVMLLIKFKAADHGLIMSTISAI
jgi:hypothetical protein